MFHETPSPLVLSQHSNDNHQPPIVWTMIKLHIRPLSLVLWFVQLNCEIHQDRPRIKTTDGDLIIESAFDKSIYLSTNGPKSSVYLGDVNLLLLNVTNSERGQYQNPDKSTDQSLNSILQRLDRLENQQQAPSTDVQANVSLLWRRVNRLTVRINHLQTLINNRARDECQSRPCFHGGTCLNLVNGYHCLCPASWEGANCDEDVNECRNFAGTDLGCQNGAECINKPGSYECKCKSNWFGLHCTRKEKDCSGGDFEMCGHGICVPGGGASGIKCICNQGWTTNGTDVTCFTDVNECESSQGPRCSANPRVDCINLPGSFRCGQCPPGYEGDGYICSDIDECVTSPNGGCSTSPLVACHNTIGSRICGSCPTGYEGDGVTCTWRGSCSINRGGCHPSAQCIDNPALGGSMAQCICPPGMEGDGVGLNGCYISVGSNSTRGGCETNPCGIRGQCHPLRPGFTCICYRGYGGAYCDSADDFCTSHPCLHGGQCRSDESSPRGFRCECTAEYTGDLCHVAAKKCGGVLRAEEGNLIYPLTNTTYSDNARCAWVIQTESSKVINVTFSKFNLQENPECLYDFLQIHDGRSSASQIIGRFCGDNMPKGGNIISSHNNLYLWFHSDQTVAKDGFALHWTSIDPVCGGEINATTHGHISSPGSPGNYPPNRDCYWHLWTTLGKRIQLNFFALDIEIHSNCSNDYIEIYDGGRTTDPLLNRYCNSTTPAPLQSAGSDMLIHFHSDGYGSGSGFQIAFAAADGVPGCGGFYTTAAGEITSPTSNGKYLSDLLCEYKIRTQPGTKVHLTFKSFNLENSLRCVHDYLKVYDGPNENSRLYGRFCGTNLPLAYTSSTNEVFLKFKSDNSVSCEGFTIRYELVCQQTILGDSGVIKSPGYPFTYPAARVCEYIIESTPGKAIQIVFQNFDLETSQNYTCSYDNLEIHDGMNANAPLLGKHCGNTIPTVTTSTHNFMYLKFTMDTSVSGTGFYANYTTVNVECGGIYRGATTGYIEYPSPDKDNYSNNQQCTWILIAPEQMLIKLTWNRFSISEFYSSCRAYVELNEVHENEYSGLGKYCGNNLPPVITTTTNQLQIKLIPYYTVYSSKYPEVFSVTYTYLDAKLHCGGLLLKPHGYIYSPGWPQTYKSKQDCTWIITAPAGQQIRLNISDFDLSSPKEHFFNDYLEIRNGINELSPIIGTFTGNFRYKRIISFGNQLLIHFHSYYGGKGFKIEWDSTITGCGGILTSPSGSITSPNFPLPYINNAECFYRIVVSAGSRIRINFSVLELSGVATKCSNYHYVEVFDGRDASSPSLGRYCGNSPNIKPIDTTTNYAFIKFTTDINYRSKGFSLQYGTICNTILTGMHGVIESPGFPDGYPYHLNCLWIINVPIGNKINLTFTHFHISRKNFPIRSRLGLGNRRTANSWRGVTEHTSTNESNVCNPDFLQVKDSLDSDFGLKLCGDSTPNRILSKSNSVQIKLVTEMNFPQHGFRLEWVRVGCGGYIQKSNGNLQIDSPLISSGQIECEWIIEVSQGRKVKLQIKHIYLLSLANCTIDSIEIYNGPTLNTPLLTKLCHDTIEANSVSSTSNFLFVRFIKHSSLKDVQLEAIFNSDETGCGGSIESLSGVIHSENYPKNYDNNMDCIWTLTVPKHHKIELNFIDFDLYYVAEEGCKDFIRVYDNKYVLGSYYTLCPDRPPTKIISTNNELCVQFVSDNSGTAKGFKANFTVTCGATIKVQYDGILSNDKWHSTHLDNNCTWTLLAPSLNQKLSLTISYMSIPIDNNVITNRKCPSSYLRFYDGDDIEAPLIDEYCGRKVPPTIVSQGSAITILFGAYNGSAQGQFSINYSPMSSACGGTLTSEEGLIASPNYPQSYPVSADCEWTLATSPGNRVYISFREPFDIEFSENCNEDYLEVREDDAAGKLLGVYCGTELPTNTTIGSKLFIKFHSDNKNTGRGFVLHYGFLHGNEITGLERGTITSPLYPNSYEGAGEYSWRIITDESKPITIFIDQVQIPTYGSICYNKLIIYDGYDENAAVKGEYCGVLKTNIELKTTSNVVFVRLKLDETNSGSLFRVNWARADYSIETDSDNAINCGSNMTEVIQPGQIVSVKTAKPYKNNLKCEWVFEATPGHHLNIHFKSLKLEETPKCFADAVSIYSSHTSVTWNPVHEGLCLSEDIRNDFNSSTFMKITFKSDSSTTSDGFEAEVSSVCGGFMSDHSGVISPSWSDFNRKYDLKCEWRIKVRIGRVLKLNFEYFNITDSNGQCSSYVFVRNGGSVEAPLLGNGKFCGSAHEERYGLESSSNTVFVSYFSTKQLYQTFRLRYEEKGIMCGGTSKLDSDHTWEVINSPNYPSVPPPYSECMWVLSGPPGDILRVDFVERFDLDNRKDCSLEYVEIREGMTEYAPLKGHYCGVRPNTIKVTSNIVYIKYYSQLAEPRNGFKAIVSIDVCGGTIIATANGEVVSPGYPNMHPIPRGTICEWRIFSYNYGESFNINFQDIQLPKSKASCDTKITVEETIPDTNMSIILRTYCSDQEFDEKTDQPIETSTNEVVVKLYIGKNEEWSFTSDSRGFKFMYNIIRKHCRGDFTTSEGVLYTPGYPRDTGEPFCDWAITVPDKMRRVRLEVLDFGINKNIITVYHGKAMTDGFSAESYSIIESSGHMLHIHLIRKRGVQLHHFKAKFTSNEPALCGGDISGASGVVVSPQMYYTDAYCDYFCVWNYKPQLDINASNFQTLRVLFTLSEITFEVSVKFSDDPSKYTSKYLRCQDNFELSLLLPFKELMIEADVRDIKNTSYYRMEWNLQPCGGIVNLEDSEVNVIKIPNNYTDTVDCLWLIDTPLENKVHLRLDGTFELDCRDEYLIIRTKLSNDPIKKYCKDLMHDIKLVLTYKQVFIEYHSNVKQYTNIKLMAKSLTNYCGGTLTEKQTMFHSPNFPQSYDPNEECVWEIKIELGNRISLKFIERFAIEKQTNCTKDVVIVYDWRDEQYLEMARLCGRALPPVFNSSSNQMKVVFRTDAETNLEGFKGFWQSICGCSLNATNKVQYFNRPLLGDQLLTTLHCKYEIKGNGQKVLVTFIDFDLEGTYPSCEHESLTIYSYSSDLSVTYCGSEIPPVMHDYEEVTLIYKTDRFSDSRRGFTLSYSIYQCGGKITNITTLSSNVAGNYDSNENCTWVIEAPADKIVVVKFQFIDLERESECSNDYIAVFNGLSIDENNRLALLCGYVPGPTVLSSANNTMVVQFVSDSTLTSKGFQANVYFTYSSAVGCGGTIDLTASSIYILKSPLIGTSTQYEKYLHCQWNINAPMDYVVKIEFRSFHIASCDGVNQTAIGFTKCDCDYVEIKNGFNPTDLVMGKYCGHSFPPVMVSAGNQMSVRLSTDGELESSGFQALLTVQRSACGQTHLTVTDDVQIIKSPGYDAGSIPRGIHCSYHLDTATDSYRTKHLSLKYVDLRPGEPDPSQCNKDKLIITSISSMRNVSIGRHFTLSGQTDFIESNLDYLESFNRPERYEFCGLKRDLDLYLNGGVAINLQTSPDSDSLNHKGVEIRFGFAGFCGRNYTETYARILSPYGPVPPNTSPDCYTLIAAPENYTISLYFITASPDYWNDAVYLDVYDGNTTSATKVLAIKSEFEDNVPVFSTGRFLLLHNHFDSVDRVTYDLNYIATDKGRGCGGKLHNVLGKLTSPLYPNFYRQKGSCEWEIETPANTRVLLHFSVFDLGGNCEQNYVQLVDRGGRVVSSYCRDTPADYTSADNYVKVVFTTTMNNAGTGWVAEFVALAKL